jgi:hypothetical protein
MKRTVAAVAALVVAAGLLVALGPARLRPWQCRDIRSAGSARAALDAYYAACWDRPAVDGEPIDQGFAPAGAIHGGAWHHLVEFSVRYDDGGIRFLIVGQKSEGDDWRPVQGEGTGP